MTDSIHRAASRSVLVCVCALFLTPLLFQPRTLASSDVPPTWSVVSDDFENGWLPEWQMVSSADLSLLSGAGRSGSTGLAVSIDADRSYLYQSYVAQAEEAYLTFWFDPNGASIPDEGSIWPYNKTVRIASIKGSEWWHRLVGLHVRKVQGQGYTAFLDWRASDGTHYDYENGEFSLVDGWQKITIGYHVDDWVAVWLDDVQVRKVSGVEHHETQGEIFEIGKTNSNTAMTPSGQIRFDEINFAIPSLNDLWVDAINGSDSSDGLTQGNALRTIQAAADLAGANTTVHILPGVYRETVAPVWDGSPANPVHYIAESGPGTAIIRGSETSASLGWSRLSSNSIGLPSGVNPSNIYYTDLSAWNLDGPPRFVMELDGNGDVSRLPLAREPDWDVATEWKVHEYWWAADGGSSVPTCNPATDSNPDCDYSSRSTTQLTDRSHDSQPAGIESGNLTTLGSLTGATLVAMDTQQGHYAYRREIVSHSVSSGQITVDQVCEHDSGTGNPGLGWGTKYYVEGKPGLLDNPGEWWYDASSERLYLWPPSSGSPASMDIEISKRDVAFELSHRSYTILDGINMEFVNESAFYLDNLPTTHAYGNTLRNLTLRFANRGVHLSQDGNGSASSIIDGFTLEDSEIAHMDTHGIFSNYWWSNHPSPSTFSHAAIVNTVIRNNEFHHLGFHSDSDNAVGLSFQYPDQIRFEGNHIHHIAHNGVQFSKAMVDSPDTYGFDPSELKIGQILVKDNLFEKACQLATDCGAVKFWGMSPNNHVFRDVLVTGNVFRDTFGWTYVSEQRGDWSGGPGSQIQGMGGKGLFVDNASGIHAFRNTAYNLAHTGYVLAGVWRDGDIVYYNNIAANSLYGIRLISSQFDTHGGSVNTQILNNILINNEGLGMRVHDKDGNFGNLTIDHNLYHGNGWRSTEQGGIAHPGAMTLQVDSSGYGFYETMAQIRSNTPWEDHGTEGDPHFQAYDADDHDLHDGSWPDFDLTALSSNAIDAGTSELPSSLTALLTHFGVDPSHQGPAFDIGRYEYGGGFVKTADILLVADDDPGSSNPYTSYYTEALDDLSQSYDLWDTGLRGAPGSPILGQYTDGLVIWSVPGSAGHLENSGVRSSLQTYLDGGGRLFISGQDVAHMTQGTDFLSDYLHAAYIQNSTGMQDLLGVDGDPVGAGLVLALEGGSSAGNQSSPDGVEPLGPAWPALSYNDGSPSGIAALRVNTGVFKVVYLSFGFEGIASASDRTTLMQRGLNWLDGSSTVFHAALSPGWNLSSWPIEPLIPAVEGALRTIDDCYCRVVGERGVYDCNLAPIYQTLAELQAGQAYYVQVDGSTSADLWVEGTTVPANTPLPLHEFWNWTGYLPETSLPIATALDSIQGEYLMVHSIDQTYNPAEPLYSTLTHMEPGQGYLIRATEAVDLVYPTGTASAPESSQQEKAEACTSVSATPHFAVIYGEVTVGATPAPEGTLIEVLDPSGAVVGCSIVRHPGHYGYMHVYGTETAEGSRPGLQESEALTFRVNGVRPNTAPDIQWTSKPTPIQANLNMVRHPAYLPAIRGRP